MTLFLKVFAARVSGGFMATELTTNIEPPATGLRRNAVGLGGAVIMSAAVWLSRAVAFYTYVTSGLGTKAGFVTGGLTFVAYAMMILSEIGMIGSYLMSTLHDQYGWNVLW